MDRTVKGNVVSVHANKAHGGVKVYSTHSLTDWTTSRSGRIILEEIDIGYKSIGDRLCHKAGTDGLNRRIFCFCQELNHNPSVVQPTAYVSVRMRLAPLIRIREDSGSSTAIALVALDRV